MLKKTIAVCRVTKKESTKERKPKEDRRRKDYRNLKEKSARKEN